MTSAAAGSASIPAGLQKSLVPQSAVALAAQLDLPEEPQTLAAAGLTENDVDGLVLKVLLSGGPATGRKIADQVRLSFLLVQGVLRNLKQQILVAHKNEGGIGDYEYQLTSDGEVRARSYLERSTYCGAAPVPLKDYNASVERQSIRHARPNINDLAQVFADLTLPLSVISQVGQAIHFGRGLFLYGEPGNGKTTIAERVIRAVKQTIWIPRTITVTGEIIRVFDPTVHEEVPLTSSSGSLLETMRYDRRWVRIKRPSIVVGGELRMEQLEVTLSGVTGIMESSIQLKANCGALVVDDFGRQRMSVADLLNRWIVPLEKGYDYLSLPSGRQIQVAFDPLLVFSTNIEPHKLVDEAFLRRIPYKIEVCDPSPAEYRELLKRWCDTLDIRYDESVADYLLNKHYVEAKRPMRYCHPRDLMLQVKTFCEFNSLPLALTAMSLDVAVRNYFAGL